MIDGEANAKRFVSLSLLDEEFVKNIHQLLSAHCSKNIKKSFDLSSMAVKIFLIHIIREPFKYYFADFVRKWGTHPAPCIG